MHHFKAADDSLHCLSDEDIANGGMSLIPPGCVEITSAEADALRGVPPTPAVPRVLTPRQIRLALSQMGYREQVEAAVAAGPLALQDAWNHALEFVRDDPDVALILAAVGATPEQADQLWTLGATL